MDKQETKSSDWLMTTMFRQVTSRKSDHSISDVTCISSKIDSMRGSSAPMLFLQQLVIVASHKVSVASVPFFKIVSDSGNKPR